MKKRIILGVDTGSDDAVALMYACMSQEFEVLGVMVSYGNQPLAYTLKNTLKIRELIGGSFKVYKGSAGPLVADLLPGSRLNTDIQSFEGVIDGKAVAVHQKEFDLPEPEGREERTPAVIWLIDTLMNSREPVTLVPVGPLTDIALALKIEPGICNQIQEIVCMGGGVHVANMTPCAEINFYNDPEAAKIVLESGIKTTLITLDATHSSWFGYEEAGRIRETGSLAGAFAADLLINRIDAANRLGARAVKKSALHDVLAVMYVSHPEVVTEVVRQKCDVDVGHGYARGGLFTDDRASASAENPVYIAYRADRDRMCSLLEQALVRA